MSAEPRTAAGRALLDDFVAGRGVDFATQPLERRILDIETQACAELREAAKGLADAYAQNQYARGEAAYAKLRALLARP